MSQAKAAQQRPTGPTVPLAKGQKDDGDIGLDDHDRLHVAEHDERGTRGPVGQPDAPEPRYKPAESCRIETGAQRLSGLNTSSGTAVTPARVKHTDGQCRVTLWKVDPNDQIYIGNGPNKCDTPLPNVPLTLETSATIYARFGGGQNSLVGFVIEYR